MKMWMKLWYCNLVSIHTSHCVSNLHRAWVRYYISWSSLLWSIIVRKSAQVGGAVLGVHTVHFSDHLVLPSQESSFLLILVLPNNAIETQAYRNELSLQCGGLAGGWSDPQKQPWLAKAGQPIFPRKQRMRWSFMVQQ